MKNISSEAEKIMVERFGKDTVIALATVEDGVPRRVDDFNGLQCTKYEFVSNKGQKLTGYLYTTEERPHGIVVMAHGFGGGGHNSYMDCANYFAHHG